MSSHITIDEFEFQERYRPILAADGSWRDFWWPDDAECMAMLAEAAPAGRVWTLVDVDGFTLVTSGRHFVNRLAYYITEVGVPDEQTVDVFDPEEYADWEAQTSGARHDDR